MRKISKKQLVVGGVAAAVIAAGTGTALAYWSTTGTGTGSATTGTSSQFTVAVDNVNLQNLTPGGPKDTVNFTVTNDKSTGAQNFSNAVAKVTGTTKNGAANPGCTANDFSITGLTAVYGDLAANAQATGSFSLQMVDSGGNQDACQGATVQLEVDAS